MANREENLKKINGELEQLSDDDLERVAGGSCYETADDSRFLNVLLQGTKYHHCDRYGATRTFFSADARSDVKAAWKSLGITVVQAIGVYSSNDYYLYGGPEEGNKITQADAWAYAERCVGRHLSKSDWDW